MPILDEQLQFWASQALTASEESDANGNVIDLGTSGRDIAAGEPMAAFINVETAADYTTGNETYQWQVLNSASSSLGTPTVVAETRAITGDLLPEGKIVMIPLPEGVISLRYLGLKLVSAGTTPTITVSAYLAPLSSVAGPAAIYPASDHPPAF